MIINELKFSFYTKKLIECSYVIRKIYLIFELYHQFSNELALYLYINALRFAKFNDNSVCRSSNYLDYF